LLDDGVAIIAEIKRATPRLGAIAPDLDAGTAARSYAAGGAAALSVLTEPHKFGGSVDDLKAAKAAGLPVLRKDFILDEIQIAESRAAGADAVLLIVRVLGNELDRLVGSCEALGMDALVEVSGEADMQRANAAGASLIGINHRDLETFELDPGRTKKLGPLADPRATLIALSGVSTRADVIALERAGVAAVLVGQALVTDPDPAAKIRMLRGLP
jgi:indole-3-glycerol phosphate synthase